MSRAKQSDRETKIVTESTPGNDDSRVKAQYEAAAKAGDASGGPGAPAGDTRTDEGEIVAPAPSAGATLPPPLGLDAPPADDPPAAPPHPPAGATGPPEASAPQFARQAAVIICPYHNVQCVSNKTEPFFTRYYCTVDGCKFSHKEPRPRMPDRIRAAEANEQNFSAR